MTEDDINNIIEEVDEDGSGTLDFDGKYDYDYYDDDDDWSNIGTIIVEHIDNDDNNKLTDINNIAKEVLKQRLLNAMVFLTVIMMTMFMEFFTTMKAFIKLMMAF